MHGKPKTVVALLAALLGACGGAADATKPNVVLIVCDDLNDYITGIPSDRGHPQAQTPNVERLAKTGVAFRRAYSNNPVCAPSRSSFLTGIYPHTSGNLFWTPWYKNPVLANSKTIMEHFRDNGYRTAGSGKLMHHFKRDVWDEFAHEADYGPFAFDGERRVAHPAVPKPFGDIGAVDGSYGPLESNAFLSDGNPKSGWAVGGWRNPALMRFDGSDDRDPTPDELNARWAADRIARFAQEGDGKPFFLGVGFIRPHTPLHVSQAYFDRFPIGTVELPVIRPNDAEDTHYKDLFDPGQKGLRYFRTLLESYPDRDLALRVYTQAYLACVAAVDDCIGQVVDAVDRSPFRDNTIIVLTSDHGWQMGQKDYLFKNSPWEESCRVPFVVRAPGVAVPGGVAEHPVSLIDLYPTLVDLCGLEGDTRKNGAGAPLDGHSVRPFLENPETRGWDGPEGALTMVYAGESSKKETSEADKDNPDRQHWTIRTERWRYIRYNNGLEELYDHASDPREWTNLAGSPGHGGVKKALRQKMAHMRGAGATVPAASPPKRARKWDWFGAMDIDGDGRVAEAEWLGWARASAEKNNRPFDADKSKAEFTRRDANLDGFVSKAELEGKGGK